MVMVLEGKLLYLKMVKGDKDATYLKLKQRFDLLIESKSNISHILDLWENEGIEKAMQVFYSDKGNNTSIEVATNSELDEIFEFN